MDILLFQKESDSQKKPKISLEEDWKPVHIETASSVDEALDLLREESFDLVVSDYHGLRAEISEILESSEGEIEVNAADFVLFGGDRTNVMEVALRGNDVAKVEVGEAADFHRPEGRRSPEEDETFRRDEGTSAWKGLREKLEKTTEKLEKVRDDAQARSKRMKRLAKKMERTRNRFSEGSHGAGEDVRMLKSENPDIEDIGPENLPSRVLALKRFQERG